MNKSCSIDIINLISMFVFIINVPIRQVTVSIPGSEKVLALQKKSKILIPF